MPTVASYPKVSLGLGFKNPTREDSDLKSATPDEDGLKTGTMWTSIERLS
jgi:hypothetical protein